MIHVLDYLSRAVVMYFTVFLAIRLLGKRTMANLTPMDRVSSITYGTVAGSVSVDPNITIIGGICVIGGFAIFAWLLGRIAFSSKMLRPVLMGEPTPLVKDGQVLQGELSKIGLTFEDLLMRLRELNIASPSEVKLAQLEADGNVGVMTETSSQ